MKRVRIPAGVGMFEFKRGPPSVQKEVLAPGVRIGVAQGSVPDSIEISVAFLTKKEEIYNVVKDIKHDIFYDVSYRGKRYRVLKSQCGEV